MSKRFTPQIPSHAVTPESVFLSRFDRRRFMTALGIGLATGPSCLFAGEGEAELLTPPYENTDVFPAPRDASFKVPEAIERKALTPREVAASHNNFYEFLPGRGGPVWRHAADYEVVPWKIEVKGGVREARDVRPRRSSRFRSGRADLPLPLRRALGDERSMDGVSSLEAPGQSRAQELRQICELRRARSNATRCPASAKRTTIRGPITRGSGWKKR